MSRAAAGGVGTASRIWGKDASLWKEDPAHAKLIGNSLGWLAMPETMAARVGELEAFAAEIRKAGFSHAAVLGMGGSSLAPEVLRRSFPARGGIALHVLDTTHPDSIRALERAAPPEKTLYLVASKSGTTVEPSRFLDYFYAAVAARRASPGGNFVAVTDPGTAMEALAVAKGFRKVFLNFPDIGGRYSALSYFGLVPAALLGLDLAELLRRARNMAEACRQDSEDNPGLQLGNELAALAHAGKDKLTFLIPPALETLGLWLEQLIAESVGKEGKGVLPVALEPLPAPDGLSRDRAFAHLAAGTWDGGASALAAAGHPVLRLALEDPLDLGAEFFRWEFATAVLGHRLGIDPFDQPDVQSAKDRTNAVLAALAKTGALPSPKVDAKTGGLSLSFSPACKQRTLPALLQAARPGDYGALLAYLPSEGAFDAPLRALRQALGHALGGAAVQAGYGPRYLHSTGQFHKGGPNTGIFVLVLREKEAPLPIPGRPYGFEQLVAAQALGDFEALSAAGRRAVLVRLGGESEEGLAELARLCG